MEDKNQNQKDTKITISLPTNAYFMSGIRDFTLSLIKNTTQFPEKWAFRFQSIVDELCNNAIEHGSSKDDQITVHFIHHPGNSIEIIVEDNGTGANPMKAEDIQKIIDERSKPGFVYQGIRGRGLAKLVKEWTDELEFKNRQEGGIRVKVKKYIKDPRQNEQGLQMNAEEKALQSEDPTHIILKD